MKVILTGHSRGLGAAIATNLLARGIPVLGIARSHNDALAHPQLQQVALDMSDGAAVQSWLGGKDLGNFLAGADAALLINNAGMVQLVGPLPTQDGAAVMRAVTLNVTVPLMMSAAFCKATEAVADRRIVHISSGAGRNGFPGWSVYCASKAALDNHARAVAQDKTPGLRICSLAPGVIDTDMQAEIRSATLDQFPIRERFEALKRDGGLASPEDCARKLVVHLLSDDFGQQPIGDIRELAA